MNDFNYDNEIIEITNENTETETNISEEMLITENKKENKPRKNIKEKWNNLTKKQKILFIVLPILILLIIVGIIIYFVIFKNEKVPQPEEEQIIVENDNYRYENGKLIFIDKNERDIGSYECRNKDSEKCFVAKSDYSTDSFERIISINENNEEINKNSPIYYNNFVFVQDGEDIFLYNIDTKESNLNLKNVKVYNTSKNLVVVENDVNKYGLLEITEEGHEYLIRPSYDNLGIVNNELVYLVAVDKDEHYIIDNKGKKISSKISADIQSVNKNYIVAKNNNNYNLYSYKYDELLSDYDYIALHDGVISLVKSNKLYLIDDELNKLYEEGIKLSNNNYVKKYIYNNNKLVETKKSYEIEINNNTASINIDGKIKNINMLEGIVSSNYSYMSYFDGKLYFYTDVEKTDLLGTYSCINKNNINSTNSTLINCNVFSINDSYSGIYNNEYVFIYDNQTNTNAIDIKHYLYDLKEKKSKGTYSNIEILNTDELVNSPKPIYTSSSYILAVSATGVNKGNYGVLEINSNNIVGKVKFEYKSITKENDYYIMNKTDDSYSIYNKEFDRISNEFTYIKLYNNYYAAISDNKLNIYSYTDLKSKLQNGIDILDTDFEIEFTTDKFIITIGDKIFNYSKQTGELIEGETIEDGE